ncbi:acyl carrier protein [Pseudonocardia nematodicida]|uniref:Acyl carrier protein n=1 Tax=Pseudonocardia nematodicida TaxID=1206997 RepID=A0ABV1KFZ6_9PSEU
MTRPHALTLDDLIQVLRASAGADDDVDLGGDVADVTFESLGYDSLALLETVGAVERTHGISVDESAAAEAPTPRALLGVLNEALAAAPTR